MPPPPPIWRLGLVPLLPKRGLGHGSTLQQLHAARCMRHSTLTPAACNAVLPHPPDLVASQDRTGVLSASCSMTATNVTASMTRAIAAGGWSLSVAGSTLVAWAVGAGPAFATHEVAKVCRCCCCCCCRCCLDSCGCCCFWDSWGSWGSWGSWVFTTTALILSHD